jgi:hypothetical protein
VSTISIASRSGDKKEVEDAVKRAIAWVGDPKGEPVIFSVTSNMGSGEHFSGKGTHDVYVNVLEPNDYDEGNCIMARAMQTVVYVPCPCDLLERL